MSIQSHTLEQTTQANGSTHNVLRMFDQDGVAYMDSFYAAAGIDPQTLVSEHIARLDAHLAEQEFAQIVGAE